MRSLCWHKGMPLCRIWTVLPVLQHRQVAPNPAAPNRWITWMDSSMNKMMVPTFLHVPICCFLQRCFPRCRHSFLVVVQFSHFSCSHIFPISPLLVFNVAHVFFIWWFFNFPIFPAPTFSPFPPFGFQCLFFCFCNYYVSDFPRWFPNDQWFFNCVKASLFPLGFCFFSKGGGRFDLGTVSPQEPKKFLQALDPQTHLQQASDTLEHQTSSWIQCAHNMPYQTSDITSYTILPHGAPRPSPTRRP